MQRDGYECQIRDIGCTNEATEVDDIIHVAIAGITRAQATDDTLQAACNNCHHRKTERDDSKDWPLAMPAAQHANGYRSRSIQKTTDGATVRWVRTRQGA